MELTPKIQKVINEATVLHRTQKRKGLDLPYVVHLFSVAIILSNYTDDEDVIVAGLLHDAIEDVAGYTQDDLEKSFGAKVAKIVKEVTEEKYISGNKKATWRERKLGYLENLKHDSNEAMLVCAADKIHNLGSMVEGLKSQGEAYLESFNSSGGDKIWFYEEVFKILKERLKSPIVKELELSIAKVKEVLNDRVA